jgi:hypothetical protein
MYTHILDAALRERSQPDGRMTTSEALAALSERRQHLDWSPSSERGTDWSSAALAHQVAYDLALIGLARSVGIDCDPSSFEQPQRRRIELERELKSRGIRLEEANQQVNSTF